MTKNQFTKAINIKNRKATYEYTLLDKYVAGIVLRGSEIKSIREGGANIQQGYCFFHRQELFLKGVHIAPYGHEGHYTHEVFRDRKLLLKKRELKKMEASLKEKGLTLVPLRLFINPRGYAKVEVALGKGKKNYDKRQSIKERESNRELREVSL